MIAYVTKNLWGYEQINPVPDVGSMYPFYITDNEGSVKHAAQYGWIPILVTDYLKVTDKLKRRSIIGEINCYPERFISFPDQYDQIFVCDSNIITLPSNFQDFVNYDPQKACHTVSGYYSGTRDNILSEFHASVNSRWSYNSVGMTEAVKNYLNILTDLCIDFQKESVSSAKYIGWNLRHPDKNKVADYVYSEYQKHLQGNIIFTMARILYPDLVSDFRTLKDDISFSPHNYVA
jgi:hypothetical protein